MDKIIVIFDKFPCAKKGSKYLVSYINNAEVTTLSILLPKMSWFLNNFVDAKTMCIVLQRRKIIAKIQ